MLLKCELKQKSFGIGENGCQNRKEPLPEQKPSEVNFNWIRMEIDSNRITLTLDQRPG